MYSAGAGLGINKINIHPDIHTLKLVSMPGKIIDGKLHERVRGRGGERKKESERKKQTRYLRSNTEVTDLRRSCRATLSLSPSNNETSLAQRDVRECLACIFRKQ